MLHVSIAVLGLLAASLRVTHGQTIPIAISLTSPSAATSVDPALVSLSIEQDRWPDFVGNTSRNTFFFNALDNFKQRTGVAPVIRIGADSEDRTNFSSSVQFVQAVFGTPSAKTPYPEAGSVVVGDGFYQIAKFLPSGTRVIWGVNLRSNNLTNAVMQAQSIHKAFQSSEMKAAGVTLDMVEIGNESGGYCTTGWRNCTTWTIGEYVKEWTQFAVNVSVAAGIRSTSATKFMGGGFAGSTHNASSFSPQGLFANGILNSTQGKLIKTISQHTYSGSFCNGTAGLLQDLMTKSTIRKNLTRYSPDIALVRAQGLDYVMGETNSYACHGTPGVSNVAGAALWTLDYALFAPITNISRIHFHHGIGYKYNLIQPATLTWSPNDATNLTTPLPPHVQPQYYGGIIATEAIGATGSSKIVELAINDTRVSGYAVYEGGVLKRAVLINSQAYLTTTTTKRGSKNVTLTFTGSGTKPPTMSIKRLAINHADDFSGLTWGGQSFETSDARPSGTLSLKTVDSTTPVTLSDTEAVLLTFL